VLIDVFHEFQMLLTWWILFIHMESFYSVIMAIGDDLADQWVAVIRVQQMAIMWHNRHPEEIPTIVSNSEDYVQVTTFEKLHVTQWSSGWNVEYLPCGNFIVILSWTQLGYVVSLSFASKFCWLHGSWLSIPSRGFLYSHYAHFICACSPSARPLECFFNPFFGLHKFKWWWFIGVVLGRTTFGFISYHHKLISSKLDFI
jgi:hypothetical protein